MKQYISLLMIGMLVFSMMASVSCDRTERPVEAESSEYEIDMEVLSEHLATGELIEKWVERIDPFVSKNKDGTFVIDWDGFYALAYEITEKDADIIAKLKSGIPVVNEMILANGGPDRSPAEPQGLCWWHWWGRRCCWWGEDARRQIVYLGFAGVLTAYFGFSAPVAASLGFLGIYCNHFINVCGGFCVNQYWWGYVQINCP